jgi:Mn2+/Fe2+ NRAMP family transporter
MTRVMLFSYPLMAAIQEVSASIGRVTGQGGSPATSGSITRGGWCE